MFEALQESLSTAIRSLRGRGKLTEANMRDGLRLVERSLLEADVHFEVVQAFMQRITAEAVGEQVLKSLDPSQQLVGIVYQELVRLMGPVEPGIELRGELPAIMLCGLQGSGKTTTCGKLGRLLAQRGRRPMLVAADLQRPAAIDQLEILAGQLELSFFADRTSNDPVAVCRQAAEQARQRGADVLLLDTAGRLHIDQELMAQLQKIDRQIGPQHVYLVVDGMTGQDAVQSAKAFNESLELDGVIMTKLDGDARGGAALSVKHITGVPIKYIGSGEHLDALEEFHPDRMAGRILGQGDILSLVEKAQQEFDQEELLRQEERLRKGQYTLDDFRSQLSQVMRLGPMHKVLGMIPGMGRFMEGAEGFDAEDDLRRLFGIIDSMTSEERRDPQRVIDASRRRRIAAGAGVAPHEVNDLVKQFDGVSRIMKDLAGKGMRERMKLIRDIQRNAAADPLGRLARQKKGTGKRLTPKEKLKLRKDRERDLRRRRRGEKQDQN